MKQLRKDKGMTQQDLADALHVSRQTVSTWETGKNYPSLDVLKSISDLFDVSFEHLLFGGHEEMVRKQENVAQAIDNDVKLKGRYKKTTIFLSTIISIVVIGLITLGVGYVKGIDTIDRVNPFLQYKTGYAKLPSEKYVKPFNKTNDGYWTEWFADDDMGTEWTKLTLATGMNPGIKDPYVMAYHKGSYVKEARIVPGAVISQMSKHNADTVREYFETGWGSKELKDESQKLNNQIHLGSVISQIRRLNVEKIREYFETGWNSKGWDYESQKLNNRIHLGSEISSAVFPGHMESDDEEQDNKDDFDKLEKKSSEKK
ncbi:helix-turn-helix domain-containing protein [Weissella ceti]|nr:helix-turn-helix transcriptional regulator [Weissella ceti]